MTPEQREAHARLASLPTWGRKAPPVDENAWRREAADKAHRTRLNRGKVPTARTQPALDLGAEKARRARKQMVHRHGFTMREEVRIVDGKYAGETGRYDGSVDAGRVYVLTSGGRRSVMRKFVRRVAR